MSDILMTKQGTTKHAALLGGKIVTINVPLTRVVRIAHNKYSPRWCELQKQIDEKKDGTNASKT